MVFSLLFTLSASSIVFEESGDSTMKITITKSVDTEGLNYTLSALTDSPLMNDKSSSILTNASLGVARYLDDLTGQVGPSANPRVERIVLRGTSSIFSGMIEIEKVGVDFEWTVVGDTGVPREFAAYKEFSEDTVGSGVFSFPRGDGRHGPFVPPHRW